MVNHFPFQNNHLLPKRNYVVQGSEILQRQRVVRQRTGRRIRFAEREVGGSKVITRLRMALLGKAHRKHGRDRWLKDVRANCFCASLLRT